MMKIIYQQYHNKIPYTIFSYKIRMNIIKLQKQFIFSQYLYIGKANKVNILENNYKNNRSL